MCRCGHLEPPDLEKTGPSSILIVFFMFAMWYFQWWKSKGHLLKDPSRLCQTNPCEDTLHLIAAFDVSLTSPVWCAIWWQGEFPLGWYGFPIGYFCRGNGTRRYRDSVHISFPIKHMQYSCTSNTESNYGWRTLPKVHNVQCESPN